MRLMFESSRGTGGLKYKIIINHEVRVSKIRCLIPEKSLGSLDGFDDDGGGGSGGLGFGVESSANPWMGSGGTLDDGSGVFGRDRERDLEARRLRAFGIWLKRFCSLLLVPELLFVLPVEVLPKESS
jgi:hypothetical protein